MSLGRTIAKLRVLKDWTQTDLAEKLGMSPNHVSRWEQGHMRPRRKTLEKIAQVFGVALEELTGEPGQDSRLANDDPELAEMLTRVGSLGDEQRRALRLFLRSMFTCQQLEHLVDQQKAS